MNMIQVKVKVDEKMCIKAMAVDCSVVISTFQPNYSVCCGVTHDKRE